MNRGKPAPEQRIPEHFCRHMRDIKGEVLADSQVARHVQRSRRHFDDSLNAVKHSRWVIDERFGGDLELHKVADGFESEIKAIRDRVNDSLKVHGSRASAVLGKIASIRQAHELESKKGKCLKAAPLSKEEMALLRQQVADLSFSYALYCPHRDMVLAASDGHALAHVNERLEKFVDALKQSKKLG